MGKLLEELKHYLENTPKEVLEEDWKELEPYCKIGPNAEEWCKWAIEQHKKN